MLDHTIPFQSLWHTFFNILYITLKMHFLNIQSYRSSYHPDTLSKHQLSVDTIIEEFFNISFVQSDSYNIFVHVDLNISVTSLLY